MTNFCYLDFEFNRTAEEKLNLVSVSSMLSCGETQTFWLLAGNVKEASAYYTGLAEAGYTFVAYSVEAEARSLMSLNGDYDWTQVQWIDLYLEYRCLLNQNHKLAYGDQLIDGKVKVTKPPVNKWKAKNVDVVDNSKPSFSLAAACYKLLGVLIDTSEKDEVRERIITGSNEVITEWRERILTYNESDVLYLPMLHRRIDDAYISKGFRLWKEGARSRGHYAALTAKMVSTGYPVNMNKVKSFVSHIPEILDTVIEDCVKHVPGSFVRNKKTGLYVRKEAVVRQWISDQQYATWKVTETGSLSLSKKAFSDWFNSNSEGFGGAFYKYLKTKESLNGFLPGGKKKFTDYVGSDNRVRPYFGIYGSQTSRSQPGATAFIPLKSHWMRNFIEPTGLSAIVGIDYSSQEFLIAALLSQDPVMIEAYESGDVYLAFAKRAKLVPPEATKSSHKKERDICKSFVLGISYEMGAPSLARKMSQDTGSEVTEERAEELIRLFQKTYSKYAAWKEKTYTNYLTSKKLILWDGWVMWGDNDSRRSVLNYPVQGAGAAIMREAVRLCNLHDIKIIFTLHDALYAEIRYSDLAKMRLFNRLMIEAFDTVFAKLKLKSPIRTEGVAWSKHYADFKVKRVDNIDLIEEYIDDKCAKDLDRFRQFFAL